METEKSGGKWRKVEENGGSRRFGGCVFVWSAHVLVLMSKEAVCTPYLKEAGTVDECYTARRTRIEKKKKRIEEQNREMKNKAETRD